MPWRELALSAVGIILSLAGWKLGFGWLAWLPAVTGAVWLAMAIYAAATGRKSPL